MTRPKDSKVLRFTSWRYADEKTIKDLALLISFLEHDSQDKANFLLCNLGTLRKEITRLKNRLQELGVEVEGV